MLQETRTNGIKLEKFKPDNEEKLNFIDITYSYDEDFKDFDDNITLDTLQFHEASNEDPVEKDNENPGNNFNGDCRSSKFPVEVDSKEENLLKAAEHKFGCDNEGVLNTGVLYNNMIDSNNKVIVETVDNNDSDHVVNETVFENNFSSKIKLLIQLDRQCIKRREKSESKRRGRKREGEAVKVKEEIECEFCHKVLTSKLSLRNHYKIHTGFDIVCEHCGKKFITRRLLLMHCRAKHGYAKTDKCSYCDYRASNAEQVKIHERLHTGEKPFVCKTCSAGFHRKSSYLQHVAIHLPDKTVPCDQCPARFKSVTLMRIHKNRHRPSPYTFKCGVCSNTTSHDTCRGCTACRPTSCQHIHRIKIH